MNRLMLFLGLLAAVASPLQSHAAVEDNSAQSDGQQLSDVRKIYVGSLGTAKGSGMIRQKMINRLSKCSDITLVDSSDKADATLLGSAEIDHHRTLTVGPLFVSSIPKFHADVALRLEGKDHKSLWTDEMSAKRHSSRLTPKGATADVADKMTDDLLQALGVGGTQIAGKKPSSSHL